MPDDTDTRELAEFGIVFLMFSIGLEFSLPQLRAMRRAVFGLGLAQVAITTAAAMVALHFAGLRLEGGPRAGRRAGDELDRHRVQDARRADGARLRRTAATSWAILLFQDLAVVAFLIIIPSLGERGGEHRDGRSASPSSRPSSR